MSTESAPHPQLAQPLTLRPETYWHVLREGWGSFAIQNNMRIGKGWVGSYSFYRRRSENAWMISPGEVSPMLGPEREASLEKIRAAEFRNLPSRNGAMWVFDSEEAATINGKAWFGPEARILEARVAALSNVHRGHLGWHEENNTADAARGYWGGEINPRPPGHWEIVVDGLVYFPNWQHDTEGFAGWISSPAPGRS